MKIDQSQDVLKFLFLFGKKEQNSLFYSTEQNRTIEISLFLCYPHKST